MTHELTGLEDFREDKIPGEDTILGEDTIPEVRYGFSYFSSSFLCWRHRLRFRLETEKVSQR